MTEVCQWCGKPARLNGVTVVSLTPVHHCDPRDVYEKAFREGSETQAMFSARIDQYTKARDVDERIDVALKKIGRKDFHVR